MRRFALLLVIAGCATRGQPPVTPIPEYREPVVEASGDPGADADLRAALSTYAQGEPEKTRAALKSFLARHPRHPSAPTAAAVLGRLALARGDAAAAKDVVEEHAARTSDPSASFILGVADSRLGNGPRALQLLKPFADAGPPPLGGTADEDAVLLLRTGLAEAMSSTGDTGGALGQWDLYYRSPGARDHEKAYARARAEDLAGRLSADAALDLTRQIESQFARAVLTRKAANALRARGDTAGARRLDDEATSLRRSMGFEVGGPFLGAGDPSRLGLAVPLSGRLQVLGEVALRGAMLAIGDAGGGGPQFQILVRDTATGAEQRTAELVREESVVGIVGVGDRRATEQTARDGVPYLVLEDHPPGRDTTAFQLIHGPESRTAELVRRALATGARSFAIIGPDSPAGQRHADAFRRAVTSGGGRVTAQERYPAGSSSFVTQVANLRRAAFDAVFVADDADRLALIAPALAVADVWSVAAVPGRRPGATRPGAPGAPPRREILLLSTAVGLSRNLVRNAGRYVQGALLSPGFFAADGDNRSASFVSRFRQLYNQDPSATDAYGYDGVRLLRTAVERGARSRGDVLRLLATEGFEGVTGTLRFGPDHGRADAPLVYTVDGEDIRVAP